MLTPKASSLTCWLKAVSRVMSGVIFFVCLTLWIFLCSHSAIFVHLKRRPPCRREFKKGRWKVNLRLQSRGQCVWFQQAWTPGNPLPLVRMFPISRAIRSCIRGQRKEPWETASGTLSKKESKTQRRVLACGKETTSLKGVAGNCNGTMSKATCLRVQWVAWNCNERLASNCKRPGLTTITCKAQFMGTLRKVFTNLRRKLNRMEDDEMFDLKTNVLIWGLFMSTTIKPAIHFGLGYVKFFIACQKTNFEGIKTLFDVSSRLIAGNSFEILNLSAVMYDFSPCMRMTLWHDQAIRWATAKLYVYSDSVLCLGKISHLSEANAKWIEQIPYI